MVERAKKIAEEQFTDARELGEKLARVMDDLSVYLGRGPKDATPVTRVKVFGDDNGGPVHGQIVRLWEETLTDGSKVYTVHIL